MSKVSKTTREDRFNALPYSKRVGKVVRIFIPLAVTTGICAALELESLTGIFGIAAAFYGFASIAVLCGGKIITPTDEVDCPVGEYDSANPFHSHRR